MWFLFAILSAVFAALTSILAKIGIEGVNSNLATAIRTVVVVIMSWGMVFLTNAQGGIAEISRKSWIFLILSGLATGASWLCYYHALQMGEASKVVPIDKLSVVITLILAFVFLHEEFTARSLIGCVLIGAGTLVIVILLCGGADGSDNRILYLREDSDTRMASSERDNAVRQRMLWRDSSKTGYLFFSKRLYSAGGAGRLQDPLGTQ